MEACDQTDQRKHGHCKLPRGRPCSVFRPAGTSGTNCLQTCVPRRRSGQASQQEGQQTKQVIHQEHVCSVEAATSQERFDDGQGVS